MKSQILTDTLAQAHNNPLHDDNPEFAFQVNNHVNQFLDDRPNIDTIPLPRIQETESIIKSLKSSKSPGLDNITNRVIRQLPSSGIMLLHLIIISSLKLVYFPQVWKSANVVAIKKPGKNTAEAKSYRPISLLSALSKIYEKTILNRLRNHIDENNIIPDDQHGFVKGKSTSHQLLRLQTHIKNSLILGDSTGLLLIDVERAFDRVWHYGLIKKMTDFNFPKYLIFLTRNFLQHRSFLVSVDGARSQIKRIPYGLPQGASLSPVLYNIFTADGPQPWNCDRALFADDTAFFTSSKICAEITKNLRETFKSYLKYFQKWKISLNLEKTQAIFFTRRRTREIPKRPLFISTNCRIPWSTEVKYLGVIFDKKITFSKHIQYVVEKTNKAIAILYPIISRNSALSLDNKLLLYKAALRPIFTYACPVYQQIAKSHLSKLQILQNKLLKMCMNLHWRTSTCEVHERANIPMVAEFIDNNCQRFQLRLNA